MSSLNFLNNAICFQHRKARLRLLPTLSWGLVTLSCVAFIFVLVYFSLTERGQVDPVEAAKTALLPLIVVQGVLLMGMGTSAVATGIARERDRELLDYHRMTPMSPAAKIAGYLFGLPVREYFLFALTLPFVAYAVLRGGVPLLKVAHFYVAFFSSVWLYHMTGLMAGMVSRKPWQSSLVSLGTVAVLYLVLPLFARVGLSFFDFLTVRPTFYGMVAEELNRAEAGRWMSERMMLVQQYESVPFFGGRFNPTAFSLVVQGFALLTMYHVVRRKWVDTGWHPFSKRFSLFFAAGIITLLTGTLWPLLSDAQVNADLIQRMREVTRLEVQSLLIGLYFVVSGLAILLTVSLITPSTQTARKGWRRTRRRGLSRVPLGWDAASSWPGAVAMLVVAAAGLAAVLWAIYSGGVYEWRPGMVLWLMALCLLGALVVVGFQGMHERFGRRAVILGLFVVWIMPVMVAIVMVAAFDAWRPAMYVSGSCPAVAGAFSLALLLDASSGGGGGSLLEGGAGFLMRGTAAEEHARRVIVLTLTLYAALAVLAQVLRAQRSRKLQRLEQGLAVSESSALLLPRESHPADPPRPAPG